MSGNRRRRDGWAAWPIIVSLLMGGCGGGGSAGGVDGSCAPPAGTQVALVYPAPGATNIPDNFAGVVLASRPALPPGYGAHVVDDTTDSAVLFGPVATAVPPLATPNAAPPFANPVYLESLNPGTTFAGGSTLTVYLNDMQPSGYCLATLKLGSFTVR